MDIDKGASPTKDGQKKRVTPPPPPAYLPTLTLCPARDGSHRRRPPTLRQDPLACTRPTPGLLKLHDELETQGMRRGRRAPNMSQLLFVLHPGQSAATFRPDHAVSPPARKMLPSKARGPHPSGPLEKQQRGLPRWETWRKAGSAGL